MDDPVLQTQMDRSGPQEYNINKMSGVATGVRNVLQR